MKRILFWLGVCSAVVCVCLLLPLSIQAQQAGDVKVATAVICKNVVDRQPVEPGSSFPVSIGKLYCYTKIDNIATSENIVHAWYYKDTQRALVTLNINPPSWRTYSSKIIQSHEIGAWRVEIRNAAVCWTPFGLKSHLRKRPADDRSHQEPPRISSGAA
ncbi:MAG: DUF2914 domain-containing protein [Desulfobacterales bacterium]